MIRLFSIAISALACMGNSGAIATSVSKDKIQKNHSLDSGWSTIHIYVALCDNKYQGIVPVPAKIGNGKDKDNNLYWGCGFGVRSYFRKSREWQFIESRAMLKSKNHILE